MLKFAKVPLTNSKKLTKEKRFSIYINGVDIPTKIKWNTEISGSNLLINFNTGPLSGYGGTYPTFGYI